MQHPVSITLEEALALVMASVPPATRTETVPLAAALGRVAAAPVAARFDLPPFNCSPLDGYALRAADSAAATRAAPALLRVVGTTYAGDAPPGPIGPGEALRVMTGAPVPPNADCVARQEVTDEGMETVRLYLAHAPGENLRRAGEELVAGAPLLAPGTRLGPAHLGILSTQGLGEVSVYARPVAGVLSTGSELAVPGAPLVPGAIYDSNGPMLAARLETLGAKPLRPAPCGDDEAALAEALGALLESCDIALTSGGVSVGQKDLMPQVVRRLGGQILFHGVRMRPGSPVLAAAVRGKPVLCLPGNPFAALCAFEVLARPAVDKLCGLAAPGAQRIPVTAQNAYGKPSNVRRLVRCRVTGGQAWFPPGGHGSTMLAEMATCNALADIPAGAPPVAAGSPLEVLLLG
ncbi:molybdopterin molybdotransferase MoeA [Ruminococcaceae bacterium OttesenSCG-928-A11]|nr:molybdopterin molybdotransferase MoeA [Ruminococcaceae bacterium OttesenSCG-928-A11]